MSGNVRNSRQRHKQRESGIVSRGKTLAEGKIQSGITQGDSVPSLLFVIAMILLNYILRKCSAWANKFTTSQEKINHFMYMNDIKQFAKKKKKKKEKKKERMESQTIKTHCQDIRMKLGTEKCAMLIMKN